MKVLLAPTEDFIKRQRAHIAADVSAGSSVVIPFDNATGFSGNDYIVLGTEGSDTAELVQITSISGQNVTVAALALAHRTDEPIVSYRYNQRKFYGSTSATGSFVELTTSGSPKTIAVDNPTGTLLEYVGDEGYSYFKATYFNSTDSTETDIDDADAVSGDASARYTSLFAIRRKAGLTNNPFIADDRLENKRKQAENEINSALYAVYTLPLSSVPPLISQIAELLAAGYIDFEEFGAEGEGVKWLGEGRAILKQITAGSRRLLDADLVELIRVSHANVPTGYPDNSEPSGPTFSMNDKF
jgi:hypothetical protein